MFSQKYKDELLGDFYQSLPQLDRIEFQNRLIQQKQSFNSMKIGESVLLICMFISSLSLASYIYNFSYLSSLGIYSSVHVSAIGNIFLVFCLFAAMSIINIFLSIVKMNKIKRENDEYLDILLTKK